MRNIPGDSFLGLLWKKNRLLFYVIVSYLCCSLATSFFGHQTTPVFLWAMYGPPLKPRNEYKVHELYGNGRLITEQHTWNNFRSLMQDYTISNYLYITDSSVRKPAYNTLRRYIPINYKALRPSPSDIGAYPRWLKKYLEAQQEEKISSLSLVEKTVRYGPDGRVSVSGSKEVQRWAFQEQ